MSDSGHGFVGERERPFTSILPPSHPPFPVHKLLELSIAMKGNVDTVKDGPDPEENLLVPAGYTYFGQFVDHDLTFDNTSSLNPTDLLEVEPGTRIPTNLRTPRFDLDCLYGDGPGAQPFMYADDGATLLYGGTGVPQRFIDASGVIGQEGTPWDLLRAPNGRAIIGDKRNDENSIVCQIQLSFLKYHNAVVARLQELPPESWNVKNELFLSAQNEVRWTYQSLILHDFLPRIVSAEVLADLAGKTRDERASAYALYTDKLRSNLPREFVAAAYRYGHSGVRTGYRLNGVSGKKGGTKLSIFPSSEDTNQVTDSLLGFDPLPKHHVIDNWKRFFPNTAPLVVAHDPRPEPAGDEADGKVQLQYAYKLDPTIVDPLGVLPRVVAGSDAISQATAALMPDTMVDPQRPSLALLNLLRGNAYGIASGQEVLKKLQSTHSQATGLETRHLCTRQSVPVPDDQGARFKFVEIDPIFHENTPLWFYILAEAQKPLVDGIPTAADGSFDEKVMLNGVGAKTQLGWVGGRIVAEVFYGLMDADKDSVVQPGRAHWTPLLLGGDKSWLLLNLILAAHGHS